MGLLILTTGFAGGTEVRKTETKNLAEQQIWFHQIKARAENALAEAKMGIPHARDHQKMLLLRA